MGYPPKTLLALLTLGSLASAGPADLVAEGFVSSSEARGATAYWTSQALRVKGDFGRTLYVSLAQVLPDSILDSRERAQMAWEIADIFRWQADFTHDLGPGDHFTILFERLISQFGEVRFGRIMAADLVVGGRGLAAYEFDDAEGQTRYYDVEGNSLRRSFLRVPVEFRRISSGFSAARFHPILQRWRSHQGIDYAAAPGSPVLSVGDGVVTRVGFSGGYGEMVEIRHPGGAVTRYAHLRGFAPGIRAGTPVVQGQCLGYVGATGLTTGPHLHFEFRVHGVATDPRWLAGEDGQPIAPDEMDGFRQKAERLSTLLHASPVVLLAGGP